jgi:(1->4)-alpha-D-glucan 1-alpha-D-glucosylmutase
MAQRHFRDFTLLGLTSALIEVVCAFPVYRTYLRAEKPAAEGSLRVVRAAVRLARLRSPALSPSLFAFLEELLLMQLAGSEDQRRQQTAFALRFQQLTGPIMAKAVEDTAFYRYTRLICRNEVGDAPGRLATLPRDFHRDNAERARSWPLSMVTTATHDTKRGDDAAARIAVLSEACALWTSTVNRWREITTPARSLVGERAAPEPTLEYLFYQSLVGVVPFGASAADVARLEPRLSEYLLKAAREAKTETSWLTTNADYEAAVVSFVQRTLKNRIFVEEVARFCAQIERSGATNALAQTLLRFTVPGVPDTYQGGELWNQSLVDPDNRVSVDYELRRGYLEHIRRHADSPLALATELLETYRDGRVKMYVSYRALQLRKALPELFVQGDYVPLEAGEEAVAFMRSFSDRRVVCVVPRLSHRLADGGFPVGAAWGERSLKGLPAGRYRDHLTGQTLQAAGDVPLASLLASFPLALLTDGDA